MLDSVTKVATGRTQELLIDAAESLYAERPFGEVTVAEIIDAAGHRNRSAVQYHFGTQRDFLLALLRRHEVTLTAQRAELLAELDTQGRHDAIERLVHVLVLPLSEFVNGSCGERAYLRVASQLSRDLSVPREEFSALVGEPIMMSMFSAYIGDADEPGFSQRVHRSFQTTFNVLNLMSDRVARSASPGHRFALEFDEFVEDSLVVTQAYLTAGVTLRR